MHTLLDLAVYRRCRRRTFYRGILAANIIDLTLMVPLQQHVQKPWLGFKIPTWPPSNDRENNDTLAGIADQARRAEYCLCAKPQPGKMSGYD